MRQSKVFVAVFVAGAAALVTASVAWACTSQASSFGLDALAAPSGSEIRATGEAVVADATPLTIRWNSASGPVVAEVTSSDEFSVPVRIPDVSPGVYYLVAVSGDTAMARAAFEVTGDAIAAPAPADSAWSTSRDLNPGTSGGNGVDSSLVAGMVLLSLGLVGLAGGFTVATARRRKATVHLR